VSFGKALPYLHTKVFLIRLDEGIETSSTDHFLRFVATIKEIIKYNKGFNTFQILINNFNFLCFNKQQIN